MKRAALLAMGCLLLGSGVPQLCRAQEAPPPPPAPESPAEPPRRPSGPGFDGRGGPARGGGERDRMDFFKQLSESERQKVRLAFEKAWSKPEVAAARERYMKANDEYRDALHAALREADPEVAGLLEKHQPPGMSPMPEPSDPEFTRKAVGRLGMELHMLSRRENRELPPPGFHERLLVAPAVRQAIEALEKAPPEARFEAWRKLLGVYQTAARTELPRREGGGRRDSMGGPLRREGPPPGDRPPKPSPNENQ